MTATKTARFWSGLKQFLREFFDFSGDNSLPFALTENDERIERGPWVYYVRAVHRGQLLRTDFPPMNILSLALYVLLSGFVDDWRAKRPWKVAVLRRKNAGMWRLKVLRRDLLPEGVRPDERRAELVDLVNAGHFDT